MSKRKPSSIVQDMLRCIEHLQTFTDGLTLEEFTANFMITEACLYNVQIMGEAVSWKRT